MRKFTFCQWLLSLAAVLLLMTPQAKAEGEYAWPANYDGVMLQGFYWDSYDEASWNTLSSQAGELADYFDLIWVPNSGRSGSDPSMGYNPVYWFTNHNSSFGTEQELRDMIRTFSNFGTGIIEDVVVNHRNGATNWYDFPAEEYKGETYQLGLDAICKNDEMASAEGQPKPTGNYDTGDNFDGCRDLDHTNPEVQRHIKAYLDFLHNDLGYVGWRYDMVKGFGASYIKTYNESVKTQFSVGEYWDGYDNIVNWIEGTGRTSAAFDFPFKFALNDAFSTMDFSKLMWKRNGSLDQPAGLIHMDTYQRYAVTFVDNHDTYREDTKFSGDVAAANAFMLCHPGTPCVLLAHWLTQKDAIKKLIAIRKSVGVTNQSTVEVLNATKNYYAAKVTGTNGELVIKVGRGSYTPSGYTNDDRVAYNSVYTVWTKVPVKDLDTLRPQVGMSPEGGHYEGGVTVTFTAENVENPADATIIYTTDGTTPSLTNGTQVKSGATLQIKERTTVKAVVAVAGTIVSVVKTATYTTQKLPVVVYFENPGWSTVNFYSWDDNGELLGNWPGTKMSETEEVGGKTWYVWHAPTQYTELNIIFNNGVQQTVDIENVYGTCFFTLGALENGKYSVVDVTGDYAGVSNVVSDVEAVVYPNPVADVLRVNATEEVARFEVYAASGAKVAESVEADNVSVAALPAGFYLYRVTFADGEVLTGRVVKK